MRKPHPARLVNKTFLLFSFWIVASWMIPGCSVGDFIGAYFNTFYNARRQFAEAEDEVLTQAENKQKDSPFGYTFVVQASTRTKFTGVIEKCSKLLQYHPESNLVDDAILMIGKSYYYENDYQPAERKFKELLEQFPNSDLRYETKLLLGYTYYMMNDKAKSSGVAKELSDEADKNGEDDYLSKASVLLAQIEVDNKNIEQAKAYYQSAAEKAGRAEDRCSAYLNLAGLLAQEGNNQRALDAYRKAGSASMTYQANYKARSGEARMLSKLGAPEESLSLLRDMLSSSNYREYFGEISFEIGNVFKESKDYPSAIAQYTYVDTSYARTETSANSYFQLGDLYESRLFQFDSAQVSYSKGKSEFPQAVVTPQLVRRADYLTKYIQLRNDIRRYDSIKAALLAPPDSSLLHATVISDSTLDSLHKRPDSTVARTFVPPPVSLDSANARLAHDKVELASLLYNSMSLTDSAETWYRKMLMDHPGCPQTPRALFTLAQIYSLDSTRSRNTSDSLYKVIADHFADSEFGPEAERQLGRPARKQVVDPAEAAYARAEKLLNTGETRGAGDSLRVIVKTYPLSPVASKAQYALGWIYERVNIQPDSALSSYRKLITLYPGSQYAALVKPKVDEYDLSKKALEQSLRDSTSKSVKDSLGTKDGDKELKKSKPIDVIKPDDPTAPPKKEKE